MMHFESNVSLIFLKYRFLSITNPSPVFKSFHLRHDNAQNSAKFIFPRSSHSKFVTKDFSLKKLLNICHASCSQIVPSFAMPSRLLEISNDRNQTSFVWTFVFVKFFLVFKRSCPQASIFVLLQKGDFPQNFLLRASKNKILNSRIRMFYQNRSHIFV